MVFTPGKTALSIDQEQAKQQLDLLGYQPGDNIYLTAFFPKGDPKTKGENRDKGRKSDRLNYTEVEKWQAQGRGVYFVVNGHGHGKNEVKDCRSVFFEHDNLDKEIQLTLWQSLKLPEPTLQVDTGGKSIHSYWVFEEPIHPELWAFDEGKGNWKGLQADLLKFANADTSLVNPNRVMRLAGCWYMVNDESGTHAVAQARIVGGCGKRYSYAELRGIIPRAQPPLETKRSHRNDSQDTGEGLLLDFRTVRHLLPEWNDRGRRGWATFQCPVHTSSGKHSDDHIHVNLTDGEWKAHCGCDNKLIYQTICEMVGHSPKPTGRDYSSGVGGGNRRNFGGGSGGSGGDGGGDGNDGKLITHPEFTPASSDEIEARIDVLIAQKASGSKLTSWLNRLAAESQWHVSELRKLYFERKGETEQTEEQVEAQSLLPSLLKVRQLNLREFLWGDDGLLAEAMIQTANAMPTSPEFLFTTLLPTAAALIGTSSRIVVKAKGKYKQPCIFLATVVGRTGQLKTPSQNVIIAPLNRLEIKANEQYQSDLEKYEIDLANWKKDKDADPADKPKLPTRKRYITKDATIESLERIHGQNPRGLLVHRDELAEDFKADNAYRGGKGGDTEKKLDQFNGSPIFTDRKEREVVLERSAISRTGSIQWEVLQSLMGDGRDDNGAFARWLFCAAEAPPRFINLLEDDIDTGIEELLTHLYKRLEKMPDRDYLLSFEAKQLFQNWQHELVRAELNESHTGLQAVYPKIEAYTARFALWLHLVNSALAEVTPPAVVGDRTMSAAIKLAKYYLDQAKLVTATNSPQSGLTGVLLKIQKYAQGKPNGVKVYKLKSAIKALRNTTPEDLLTHCTWLTEHGYGSLKDNTYFVDRVDQLLPTGSTRSTPDSTVISATTKDILLTNCCPQVNTVNNSGSGSSSDFVDFVDQNDPPTSEIFVTQLNNQNVDQISIEVVNTVNNSSETPTESGVDLDQQLVNKGQQGQQTGSADNAIAPMPVEVAPQPIKTGDYVRPLPETTAYTQLKQEKEEEVWEVVKAARPVHCPKNLLLYVRPIGSKQTMCITRPAEEFELAYRAEDLEAIARDLTTCEDSETLDLLRDTWGQQIISAASKLLSAEKQSQLKAWGLNSRD